MPNVANHFVDIQYRAGSPRRDCTQPSVPPCPPTMGRPDHKAPSVARFAKCLSRVAVLLCWGLVGVAVTSPAQTVQTLPNGLNVGGSVSALAVQADGSIVVAGSFNSINGVARNNLARLHPDGSLDGWNPGVDGSVMALAVSASTVYVGGSFGNIGGQAHPFLGAIDASSGLPLAWNPGANQLVAALAVSDDRNTVYAGGFFTSLGGQARSYIGAVNSANGVATNWNPSANSYVRGLSLVGNTLYAIGDFTAIGGSARTSLVRFNTDGSLDTLWNPAPDSPTVIALAISSGTAFAGGKFLDIGGQALPYLAALDASSGASGAALPWNADPASDISALAIAGSTVYAGGSFAYIGGQERARLAALDLASGLATGWNPTVAGGSVTALAISGSSVYVAGTFTTISGQPRIGIAALSLASAATVPGAPTIGTATAIGDTQATISFTAPANDGGNAIAGYTVDCTDGGTPIVASGPASPITITGLTYLTTYACSVTASNGVGTSLPSASINVTPGDLIFRNGFD